MSDALCVDAVSSTELSSIIGITREGLKKLAKKLGFNFIYKDGIGRGGKTLHYTLDSIPAEYRNEIIKKREETKQSLSYSKLPDWAKQIVEDKTKILAMIRNELNEIDNKGRKKIKIIAEFVARYNSGSIETDVRQRKESLSIRTIIRWMNEEAQYQKSGDIQNLAPMYGKRKGVIKLQDEEKEFIHALYNHPNRLNILTIFEDYRKKFESIKESLSSYSTVYRFVKSIPVPVVVRAREGKKALENKVMPYTERDTNELRRNQIWQSDGHKFNFFALDERGRPVRLIVVVWIDIFSRIPVGYSIDYTENTDVVLDSLMNGIQNNGLPETVYTDHGKAFKNKDTKGFMIDYQKIDGTFERLGIAKQILATPYNAKAKAQVEGFWNVVNNKFSRKFNTYCGKDNEERKEDLPIILKDTEKMPTIQDVYDSFGKFLKEYINDREHKGDSMNMTPCQKWNSDNTPIKKVSDEDLMMDLLKRQKATVQRNGVKIFNSWYIDKDAKMTCGYFGQKVIVGIDRRDLSAVRIFDLEGILICVAERKNKGGYDLSKPESLDSLRRTNRLKKKVRKLVNEQIKTKLELTELENTYLAKQHQEQKQLEKKEKPDKKDEIDGLFD